MPKKGDLRDIRNWRPTNYEILSKGVEHGFLWKVTEKFGFSARLSRMLYALCLEPPSYKNKIGDSRPFSFSCRFYSAVILSAHDDDVVVFVRAQKDVGELTAVIKKFSAVSAARVNWRKSEALAVV